MFTIKIIALFFLTYILVLFFSFLSEVTYKKRAFQEVKNDARQIWKKATLIFIVIVVAIVGYNLLGIDTK